MMVEKPLAVCNYAAAFIDVLGQSERLGQFARMPNLSDPKVKDEFFSMLRSTVGAVQSVAETIDEFFVSARTASLARDLPKPLVDEVAKWTQSHLVSQRFSDGVLLYTPMASNIVACAAVGIHGMISAIGTTVLVSLARRIPIRGALDIGWGVEYSQGELYGGIVSSCYALESRISSYPRIVIGPNLVEFLDAAVANTATDTQSRINRAIAVKCREKLAHDDDGFPFIDYLGAQFWNADLETARNIVRDAYRFVLAECEAHQKARNTKLAFRYTLLRNYFEGRDDTWKVVE